MQNDLKKILRSFRIAMHGIRHAYRLDKSFRLEINYGLPVYIIVGYLLAPFRPWEFLVFVFTYLFILFAELINTAFEKMLDRLHPEEHELIGKSKDIASAALLVSFLFALIVVVVLAYERITYPMIAMVNTYS